MDFKQLCEDRYSVRAYLSKKVEKEKIDYLLECIRLSPSAHNYQPWEVYVIEDAKMKEKVQASYDREWIKSAPCLVILCKNITQSWKRESFDNKDLGDVDIAIAGQNFTMAATSIGLGSCWVCNFDPDMLSETLDLSKNVEPVVIFPLGYIDTEKSVVPLKKRKNIDEIVTWI